MHVEPSPAAVRVAAGQRCGVTDADGVQHLAPSVRPGQVAAGVGVAAVLMRFVRAGLLEVLGSDYVRTARAKGLSERRVILGHAMRNGLIPVVTVAGLSLAGLLGGLVITETVLEGARK